MSILNATYAQTKTLNELVIKLEIELQKYRQGSVINSKTDAAEVTRINAILAAAKTALDAVVAA